MRIYLIVLLILAGCATRPQPQYRWDKPGSNRAMFDAEFSQCEQAALSSHPGHSVDRGVQIFAACMRGKGWSLVER